MQLTSESTEQRIIKSALKHFSERGYEGAKTKEIAADASVNEVTLFRKFKSKQMLFEAVISQVKDEVLQALRPSQIVNSNDTRETLKQIALTLISLTQAKRDMILLLLMEAKRSSYVSSTLSTIPQAGVEYIEKYLESQIKRKKIRKINTGCTAIVFSSYIFHRAIIREGLLKESSLTPSLTKELDCFLDIILEGILPKNGKEVN